MDIMNRLPEARFRAVDDLLAFISIYDDENRTRAYENLLRTQAEHIRGAVCVEAGCGLGIFSARMAELGARKVYAVEHNPMLAELARRRLDRFPNVEVVQTDLRDFRPPEKVDLLLHELYGQLLFDEDLFVLEELSFSPARVIPDGGRLLCGVLDSRAFVDDVVSREVLQQLHGVLVSGLFDDDAELLQFPVFQWRYGAPFPRRHRAELSGRSGDLLVFGVQVTHENAAVCTAGACPNWSLVWTPRAGDRFEIEYLPGEIGEEVQFTWTD